MPRQYETDLHIVIPTYRRTNAQHTYSSLPKKWKERTTFVVDAIDHKSLDFKYGTVSRFLLVPDSVKTIAQKRKFIIEGMMYEKIMMFDDDLRFAARLRPGSTKLIEATHEKIDQYLSEIEEKLDTIRHVGISARQGNNNLKEKWVENTRMMYALGYHLPTLREHCTLGRIETREDMDYALQLLRKGFKNVVLSDLCVDQKYNAPGGASLERTIESSNRDADLLAELHPGLVTVREKNYASSIPRKEVICSWKKAYNARV